MIFPTNKLHKWPFSVDEDLDISFVGFLQTPIVFCKFMNGVYTFCRKLSIFPLDLIYQLSLKYYTFS